MALYLARLNALIQKSQDVRTEEPFQEGEDEPSHVAPRMREDILHEKLDDFVKSRAKVVPFDYDNPSNSVSRTSLRPIHRDELVSALIRAGDVTASIIQRFGCYCGIPMTLADISAALKEDAANGKDNSPNCGRFRDSDSEPDPDEDDKPGSGKSEDKMSPEKRREIVWLLKKELHALHREAKKKKHELEQQLQANTMEEPKIPSYKQHSRVNIPDRARFISACTCSGTGQEELWLRICLMKRKKSIGVDCRSVPIASTRDEYQRLTQSRLFTRDARAGSVYSLQTSSQISVASLVTDSDDTASVTGSEASTATLGDHRSQRGGPFFGGPLAATCQPEQDPRVFPLFYPSQTPPGTLKLPIFTQTREIMGLLESRRVVIISAPTGTGKTTQVPLMVLDECARKGSPCNIIVTQPRRIAAIGVARRVCEERKWNVGQLVGYHVGLERNTSQSTRLIYCTTGVFVEKIIAAKHLNRYTHIFLDEVHERDQDTDLALMLVRQMLLENSLTVQVVLMSATVEINRMCEYFNEKAQSFDRGSLAGKLNITVSGYEVTEFFLEDFGRNGVTRDFDIAHPRMHRDLFSLAVRLLDSLAPLSDRDEAIPVREESVLVFLPGLEHIQELAEMLAAEFRDESTEIAILHSTVSKEEQVKTLTPPAPGVRRILLSTNIAESSLTIPYVNYVFDFCLTKVMKLNPYTKIPQLTLQWASESNASQRRGRVGRVRKGCVYYFVPKAFLRHAMHKHPVPQILMSPLENTVLRVKQLEISACPAEVLILLPDAPKRNDVELAVLRLKAAGAMTVNHKGEPSYDDGDLTAMGQMMAVFPVDIRVAKFLFLCAMLGYAYEGVIIAAGMTVESVLTLYGYNPVERHRKLTSLYGGPLKSDPMAILRAYENWTKNSGSFRTKTHEKNWCQDNLIDVYRMKELSAERIEICQRINRRGFAAEYPREHRYPAHEIIPLIFAGAFYPNVCVNAVWNMDRKVERLLQGLDPLCTVMIEGFGYDNSIQAPIYDDQLHSIIRSIAGSLCVPPKIIYGNYTTIVNFSRSVLAVAVDVDPLHPDVALLNKFIGRKQNSLALSTQASCPDFLEILDSCHDDGLGVNANRSSFRFCVGRAAVTKISPPSLDYREGCRTPVIVSDISRVELFSLAVWDERAIARQLRLQEVLAGLTAGLIHPKPENITIGEAYLTRNPKTQNACFRTVVLSNVAEDGKVTVFLPDLATYDRIPATWLRDMPPDEAMTFPRASFEFSFVRLRFTRSQKELAKNYIETILASEKIQLFLEIYSVLDGVVRGNLFWQSDVIRGREISVADELVKLGYAYYGEESKFSEHHHKLRLESPVLDTPVGPMQSAEETPEVAVPSTPKTQGQVTTGPVHFPALTRRLTIDRQKKYVYPEQGSLNSLAVEEHFEDNAWPYRPMAAAFLEHPSASEDRLRAYYCTELPIQPGLLPVLAMVFAPYVEVQVENGQYVGVLTGLGPFPGAGHSFFPDCEVNLLLDGCIVEKDIDQVNLLRSKMNDILRKVHGAPEATQSLEEMQDGCADVLMKLVGKCRKLLPKGTNWKPYEWSTSVPTYLHKTAEAIFLIPVHAPSVSEHESDQYIYERILELHRCAEKRLAEYLNPEMERPGSRLDMPVARCVLCDTPLTSVDFLVDHVFSIQHMNKEKVVFAT